MSSYQYRKFRFCDGGQGPDIKMSSYQYRKFRFFDGGQGPDIKMSSYQYRKFHCGDKTVVRSSYLHNGISYTGKMTSLYWIRTLVIMKLVQLQAIVMLTYWQTLRNKLTWNLNQNTQFFFEEMHLKIFIKRWQLPCLVLSVLRYSKSGESFSEKLHPRCAACTNLTFLYCPNHQGH